MAERMTTITLPGVGGFQDYGRQSVEHMIALYRTYAEHRLREAQAVLAAADQDFRVYTHTGVHVERDVAVLQEGRIARQGGSDEH